MLNKGAWKENFTKKAFILKCLNSFKANKINKTDRDVRLSGYCHVEQNQIYF